MSTALFYHPYMRRHTMPDDHPESESRLDSIHDKLLAKGLDYQLEYCLAKEINPSLLTLVHSPEYLTELSDFTTTDKPVHFAEDIYLNSHTLKSARLAAGAGIMAVDAIMQGKIKRAFCLVRPPGHHAEVDQAMGFCIYNNIALAAAYAVKTYQLTRILIIDFDVHHGNGTEQFCQNKAEYLFCSSFQHPFYPETNINNYASNVLKLPLSAGEGGAEFRLQYQTVFEQFTQFKPELILISAGFDGHSQDDIAQLNIEEADYIWLTDKINELAKNCESLGIVSMLEGGYELHSLSNSVTEHIKCLMK